MINITTHTSRSMSFASFSGYSCALTKISSVAPLSSRIMNLLMVSLALSAVFVVLANTDSPRGPLVTSEVLARSLGHPVSRTTNRKRLDGLDTAVYCTSGELGSLVLASYLEHCRRSVSSSDPVSGSTPIVNFLLTPYPSLPTVLAGLPKAWLLLEITWPITGAETASSVLVLFFLQVGIIGSLNILTSNLLVPCSYL